MKFLIGSSYFENGKGGHEFRSSFALHWYYNTLAMEAEKVVIICQAGSKPPIFAGIDYIHHDGDMGHSHDLIENKKPNEFSSWSASMLSLALLAYDAGLDYVYKEEDALAFPPRAFVERMYADMGTASMIFGRKMQSPPWMPAAQSIFLVRHSFIPAFVLSYLSMGGERDRTNLGEIKFVKIAEKYGPQKCRRLTVGVDRERPIPWDDPIWYAQQWTPAEVEEASKRGLL